MRREGLVARGANDGMSVVGFLDEGAEQAGVVRQLAGEDRGAEVDVPEETIQWVLRLMVGRRCKETLGHRSPVGNGGERQVVLALEMMEEAAFGHSGFMTDVVDRGEGIPFRSEDME